MRELRLIIDDEELEKQLEDYEDVVAFNRLEGGEYHLTSHGVGKWQPLRTTDRKFFKLTPKKKIVDKTICRECDEYLHDVLGFEGCHVCCNYNCNMEGIVIGYAK